MSTSKWAWTPACDSGICVGDCDLCDKANIIEMREHVRGRWDPHPIKEHREWDVCSACGIGTKRREYGINEDGREWMIEYTYQYCPHCGARMNLGRKE